MSTSSSWPSLPLSEWGDTCETLHRWTQIVGKVRMALTPLVNHWWNVPLYVTRAASRRRRLPHGARTFEIAFDFVDHQLRIETSDGATERIALAAHVGGRFLRRAHGPAAASRHRGRTSGPCPARSRTPFPSSRTGHAQYDRRHGAAILAGAGAGRPRVQALPRPLHRQGQSRSLLLGQLRSGGDAVLGSHGASAWGVTPNVLRWVMAEAYSHEVCSCGFWPGNGGYGRAAFNVYAYPELPALATRRCARRDLLRQGPWAVHPALRRGSSVAQPGRGPPGLSSGNL